MKFKDKKFNKMSAYGRNEKEILELYKYKSELKAEMKDVDEAIASKESLKASYEGGKK